MENFLEKEFLLCEGNGLENMSVFSSLMMNFSIACYTGSLRFITWHKLSKMPSNYFPWDWRDDTGLKVHASYMVSPGFIQASMRTKLGVAYAHP